MESRLTFPCRLALTSVALYGRFCAFRYAAISSIASSPVTALVFSPLSVFSPFSFFSAFPLTLSFFSTFAVFSGFTFSTFAFSVLGFKGSASSGLGLGARGAMFPVKGWGAGMRG